MSVVVLENISLGFGKQVLFEGLGLRIADRDRIGLIGPNGSGKTSILRIIAREQAPDAGSIEFRRGARLGYLPQELEFSSDQTLRSFVRDSVAGRAWLESEVEAAEREMERLRRLRQGNGGEGSGEGGGGAEGEGGGEGGGGAEGDRSGEGEAELDAEMIALAERLSGLHERLTHYDIHYSEREAYHILAGLGFKPNDLDRCVHELSGGWKMRAMLASLLFQQPDLLLLDEPTNHLDMPTVAWFADFLKSHRRACVLICHDREFLNEQIERIISIEQEGVRQYAGNYEAYVKQRAEEEAVLENKAKNLERQRQQAQRFISRNRARKDRSRQVQSRIKALEKMESAELYRKRRVMRFSFPPCPRAGQDVVRVQGLRKAYGQHVVFDGLDLNVQRGEKIGIIGSNGAGKTTLLKLMAGELTPDGGVVELGTNVNPGYFAQHLAESLSPNATAFEEVAMRDPDASITRVRTLLGAFLFSGDDVDKKIHVLSGGERSRVALARLLINPGNLLMMDEPTNHLDLESSESLADSLSTYDGTLVFVSHNRSLVRRLATRIWHVEAGKVETYPGTLDEYMDSCKKRTERQDAKEQRPDKDPRASSSDRTDNARKAGPTAMAAPATKAATAGTTAKAGQATPQKAERGKRAAEKERKRLQALVREERSRRLSAVKKRVSELEEEITRVEELQKERSELLADPGVYADKERSTELIRSFREDKQKLEELTFEWEQAQARLEP